MALSHLLAPSLNYFLYLAQKTQQSAINATTFVLYEFRIISAIFFNLFALIRTKSQHNIAVTKVPRWQDRSSCETCWNANIVRMRESHADNYAIRKLRAQHHFRCDWDCDRLFHLWFYLLLIHPCADTADIDGDVDDGDGDDGMYKILCVCVCHILLLSRHRHVFKRVWDQVFDTNLTLKIN